ncbi:PstS family phosphate ABC transporter substrate-binding protein [Salipaludibacillus sp. CF4.18]|uniref:PstS family phosphate ABC transporter substrate-binding protein n=1 Tax=Salipaludibacillus sp. CF4.18 TaxID=3373081 RepID=UPI003EE4B97D
MKRVKLSLMLAGLITFAVACGEEDEASGTSNNGNNANNGNETTEETNEETSEEISGTVSVDGSGTVYPLMARLAEEYMTTEQAGVSVEVGRAGTSAGMEKFINGETDLSNASRPVKEEELAGLEEAGIESKEFKVALDGLTIVIHPDNDWANEMTEEEIKEVFVTGNFKDDDVVLWSDVRPEWPEEEINFYGPNENHGTYEFFVDEIIEEQDLVEGINLQQEYSTLVELVSEDENAIGFFGFGYYTNNDDKLGAVHVDFGDGPVEPTLETIGEESAYAPFTRPVFTNLSVNAAQEKPEVKDFIKYVLTAADDFSGETGFAPLPEEELNSYLEEVEAIE